MCSGRYIVPEGLLHASAVTDRAAGRAHVWIRGRVQGVGFRFFAEQVARRWGVSGFVHNLPDGRVEVIAEGSKEALDAFVNALHRGPAGADVHELRVEWETPAGLTGFWIR